MLKKTFKYTKRITDAFTHLRRRALASSINKPLSLGWDYITEQADQYRYKYKVAIGQIQDAVVNQMIDDEAQDFGITPTQMRALIVQMFEIGDAKYTAFTAMIERGRTKALTAVENTDWNKAETLTVMLESVPEQLTMEQAEQFTTNLLNV
jgi:flavodoxin